jgi:hypothetical protein
MILLAHRFAKLAPMSGAGTDEPPQQNALPPRVRRAIELVYGVEGVTAARVWQWSGKVAVGVRISATSTPAETLRRVESAVAAVREPDEVWEFGLLEDDAATARDETKDTTP